MKICPLCQKELIKTSTYADWCCPTLAVPQLWTIPHPHYMANEPSHDNEIERFFVDNYQVVSSKHYNYAVYKLGRHRISSLGKDWIQLAIVPAFQITSPEQLLNKIKTILTFS